MSSTQSSTAATEKVEDDHKAKWYPWHGNEGPSSSHHGNDQTAGVDPSIWTKFRSTHEKGGCVSAESDYFYHLLREQRLEYESKYLSLKNELISTRGELLTLRETVSTLRGEMNKLRPLIDERKRNSLLRKREPFPFTPEHTKQLTEPSNSTH